MVAGKFADFYGSLAGNAVEQADVARAYTQAPLMGTNTWVRPPKREWPKAWCELREPVVPLVLAAYGHPGAGSRWEARNDEQMKGTGFRTLDGWPGCYTHPNDGLFMTVDVANSSPLGLSVQ